MMNGLLFDHDPSLLRNSYLGCERKIEYKERRKRLSFSENSVPAYVPTPFIKNDAPLRALVDDFIRSPRITLQNIASIESHIEDHFESRIAIFWTQILLVYKTGLSILGGNCAAPAQYGKGPLSSRTYAAAHSSTLSMLRISSPTRPDKMIILGQGEVDSAYFYKLANVTTWMPRVVNDVDSALDFKSESLRNRTIEILQSSSNGILNPEEGLYQFLINAQNSLKRLEQKFKNTAQEKNYILTRYQNVVRLYLNKTEEDDRLIKTLCYAIKTVWHGEELYMRVQAEMHAQFIGKMNAFRPHVISNAITDPNQILCASEYLEVLKKVYEKNLKKVRITKTFVEHVSTCLNTENVRKVGILYLTTIPTQEVLETDMAEASKIKTQQTIGKLNLRPELKEFYNELFRALSGKNCRNMSLILIKTLHDLSANPLMS